MVVKVQNVTCWCSDGVRGCEGVCQRVQGREGLALGQHLVHSGRDVWIEQCAFTPGKTTQVREIKKVKIRLCTSS